MNNAQEKKTYDPLPEGFYNVKVNRVNERTSKKGGTFMEVSYQVQEGDHKNRLIFDRFILESASVKATEIGLDRLDNFLKATGINGGFEELGYDRGAIENTIDSTLKVKVRIDPPSNGYGASNKVTSFKAI